MATDWLELVVLISQETWSRAEVVDVLIEGEIYEDQDFAAEFVDSVVAEVNARRHIAAETYPIEVVGSAASPLQPWENSRALMFCLLASVGPRYSGWSESIGGNYVSQGDLFEGISTSALRHWFPGWVVTATGWGDGNALAIADLVALLAELTREDVVDNWEKFCSARAKDFGLDIAVVRNFPDGRAALPVLMVQCASGSNWTAKLHTPDTQGWLRLITLTHEPTRGVAIPFALSESTFHVSRNRAHGVLLDRYRLMPNEPEAAWLDGTVAMDLDTWCHDRLDWLADKHPLEEVG